MAKNSSCLWYYNDAEGAARLCAGLVHARAVAEVQRALSDCPSGTQGAVLTVAFTVAGIPFLGINGGPAFKHNEALSFQIATDNQHGAARYCTAIVGNAG